MAHHSALITPRRAGGLVCALTACLLGGGCAQQAGLPADLLGAEISAKTPQAENGGPAGEAATEQQLAQSTAYWGKRYAEAPTDLETAISYAKSLKQAGHKQQALAVLQQASVFHGDSRELAGEYGRLALELGQLQVADKLLAFADDPAKPDWRVISARGTVLAKQGKYAESIPFYERALTLAHNHPSLLNNLAMAHAMMGDASKAEGLLRQAAQSDESPAKVRQNLALVLGLQGKYQESTQVAARDLPPAAAEDVEYLRKLTNLSPVAPTSEEDVQVARVELKGTNTAGEDSSADWAPQVVSASKY